MLRPDSRNIVSQWILASMCMVMTLPVDALAANRTVIVASVTDDYQKPSTSREVEQRQKRIEAQLAAIQKNAKALPVQPTPRNNRNNKTTLPLPRPDAPNATTAEERLRAELRGEALPTDQPQRAVVQATPEPQQTEPAPPANENDQPDPEAEAQSGEDSTEQPATTEVANQPTTQPNEQNKEADPKTEAAKRALEETRRRAATRTELVGPPAYYKNQNLRRNRDRAREAARDRAAREAAAEKTEPETVEVPQAKPVLDPDGKTEWFNFVETPWEDVIKHFAERLDKPVIGLDEVVFASDLTYVNPKKFTLEEAIDELNYLMQIEGYRFVETENHIKIIPLSEMPYNVPLDRIFATRAAYEAERDANKLRRMDYVTVYYLVPDQPAQLLADTFGNAIPDYTRCTVVGDTNKLKLIGTVGDIEKFFDLVGRIELNPHDPRQYKVIEIKTNAKAIEEIVRDILELPDTNIRNTRVNRNRRGQPQQLEEGKSDLPVRVTADERTNSLIVYATPKEVERVERLVKEVDKEPPLGDFHTKVVKIEYADATEVASLMMDIFRQEQGNSQPSWQQRRAQTARQRIQAARNRRNNRNRNRNQQNQPQEASPESIIAEGLYERAKKTIRMSADDRTNSLLVYANDEGQKRVAELLEIIDVPVPSNFQTFVIQNADASKIYPTVEQIVSGLGSFSTRGSRRNTSSRVVLDAGSNALHVVAEREDMVKIEEIIQQLDVEGVEQVRHVIYLENLKPSQVAPTVQALLAETSATSTSNRNRGRRGPRRGRSRGGAVVNVEEAQVIALDEARMLIVVCDEEDWTQVEETIRTWDNEAVSDRPVFASYELQNGDATQIAQTLDTFYRNYQHPVIGSSPVLVAPEGNSILVQAIQPAQDEIKALIERLDTEDIVAIEVLALQHADANDVAEQLQRLFADSSGSSFRRGGRRGGRRGPISTGAQLIIEAEPSTNSLIVKADPDTLAEIKDFALAQDMRVADLVPERRFYTLEYAKPRDVVNAINGLFGSGGGSRFGRGRQAASNSQVTALETDRQVIVEAPAEKQTQIAEFIAQLDSPEGREIVTTLVKMPGGGQQVSTIARNMTQTFRDRVRNTGITADFVADPTTETILISASKSIMEDVEKLVGEYKEFASPLAMQRVFRKLQHAAADEAANWLTPQLQASVTAVLGSNAARQVQVTPDMRTGRIVIYAPSVAVKEALQMLDEYDTDVPNPVPEPNTKTVAIELPGLDVQSIARSLDQVFSSRQRPDRQRARFAPDALTEIIVATFPNDWEAEINELIAKFSGKAEEIALVQQFYEIGNADAAYVAQKINEALLPKIRRGRGASMTDRVTVTVDDRANRVVVNAPAVIHEDIKPFITEIDIPADSGAKLRTVKLENANAPDANNILQQVFRDKIQKEKRLQVSVDAVTNSIIIRGSDEDYQMIADWLTELDASAVVSNMATRVFPLKNVSNPWEVVNVLNQRYQSTGQGRRSKVGNEVKFFALGDTSVVAVAPNDKMTEIEELIGVVDREGDLQLPTEFIAVRFADPNEIANVVNQVYGQGTGKRNRQTQNTRVIVANQTLVVKAPAKEIELIRALVAEIDTDEATDNLTIQSFHLDVMDASTVANQVNFLLATIGLNTKKGEMKPFAFGESATNTLIVGAPPKYMTFIANLINGIEANEVPSGEPRTYALQYVRANTIQPNVEALLQAKVAEKTGGRRGQQLPVKAVAVEESNTLVVYAQPEFQELAKELIAMLDKESESGEVVQIVKLERGDAEQLARTLEQLQGNSIGGSFGRGRGRRGRSGGDPSKVTIAADAGSNSLIFRGMPQDVAEMQEYVRDIESKTELTSELRVFNLKYANTTDVVEVLTNMFASTGPSMRGQSNNDRITITEDAFTGRIIAVASHRKLDEMASIVDQLDVDPYASNADSEGLFAPGGKQIYFVDIYKGDAGDIVWDVEDLFPSVESGGPDITSDWDGKYIKVVCRPGQFPAVEKAIRQIEARAKPTRKVTMLDIPADPEKQERYLGFLKSRMQGVNIEMAPPVEDASSMIVTLRPDAKKKKEDEKARQEKANGRRSSAEWNRNRAANESSATTAGAIYELATDTRTAVPQNAAAPQPRKPAKGTPAFRLANYLENGELNKTMVMNQDPAEEDNADAAEVAPSKPQREAATVVVRPDGKVLVSGPESEVDEVEEIFEILSEDLSEGQVIRIFEFTYGDVNAAAEVLNIMFNDRQRIQIPQRNQQQQQQQRNQRGGNDGNNGRNQQGGLAQQLQQMVGGRNQQNNRRGGSQSGGQRIRIATDAGHNYLIVKCEEADLPEITKLLRELDIPPGDVELKVFQLVNLDATETADNIKAVLGVDKAKGRRSGGGGAANAARGRNQQQLLEMLQTQMVTVPGVEGGAKVESVEIVPNKLTNSIMVSSPPEVMKLIESIITELEELEGRGVIGIYYYDLENARVTDVLPLLQSIFEAAASGRGASPAALGPVTLSADPRNNRIIYTAEAKDVDRVRAQIATLDIAGTLADAETHLLQFGNAEQIAQTLQAIFSSGDRNQAGVEMVRIAAEPSTNTITVWGPLEKRNEIFAKMFEFEEMSVRAFREITVVHADAEELADKVSGMFGAAQPSGSRGGQSAMQSPGSVVIFGDENAKKILVKAPDAVFDQIQEVVQTFDQPDNRLQMKNFQLKHADAEVLVDKVKSAFIEYVAMLPRSTSGKPPFDPFTVVADPRTNTVTVVGTEDTFVFVGALLAEIDVPTTEDQRKQFRVFALDKADAMSVADAINVFARGGQLESRGRGGRGPGGSGMDVPLLDVNAVAEPTLNAVMVFGKTDDIAVVKTEVIDELKNLTNIERFETIAVNEAVPSQIIYFIEQFLDDYNQAGDQDGSSRRGPKMIPNDNGKEIVVKGTPGAIDEIRSLIERFDRKDLTSNQVKVRRIAPGRDAFAVAQQLERVVNEIESQQAALTNRQPRPVVIGTDDFSNSVIVAADAGMIGMVDSVIDQIEAVDSPKQETRVIQLTNLTAETASQVIGDLQNRANSGSRTGGRSGFNRNNRGSNRGGFNPRNFNRGNSNRGGGNFNRGRNDGGRRQRGNNRGNRNRRSGRGAFMIDTAPLQQMMNARDTVVSSGRAVVASTSLLPTLAVLLADQVAQPNDSQPRRAFGADVRQDEANAPQNQPMNDVAAIDGVSGSLENDVTVQEISNKQIIISGDADDLDYIEQILRLMEAAKVPTRIEIFTLEQAKAPAIATIVTEVMTQYIESLGTPGPEDRVSVSVEAKSNSLIVSASDTNMEIIAQLVDRLDSANQEGQVDFKTVPLMNARAAEVVTQLTPTLERLATMRSIPTEAQPTIQAVDQSNSVLVIGTPADVADITRLIKEVDIAISEDAAGNIFTRAEVIVLPLQNAVAEDVAEVLSTLIEEQQTAAREAVSGGDASAPYVRKLALKLPDGTELPELDLQKPIKIIPEKGTNSLIIFSAAKNLVPLQAIVGVFDTLPKGNNINVRAFVLTYAKAESTATMLEEVFTAGKGALKRAGEGSGDTLEGGVLPPEPPNIAGKGLPYNVAVTHDNRSNTVVVIGHEDAVLLAGGLIAEIDRPSAQLGIEQHIIELKNVAATKIAESVNEILEQRASALGDDNAARDSAVVIPEDRSNLLIVFGTREIYQMIEDLVDKVDKAAPYTPIGTRFVRLQNADAMKLQSLLQEFFDKRREAEVGDEPKNSLSVLADSRTNSLLMTGTRDWLQEAEQFISQFDAQGIENAAMDVAIIPVRFNSAANVATLLQDVVDKSQGQDEEGTPITISADPVSQNLIVAASREDLGRVRRWIDLIDTPAGDRPGLEVAIIPLARGSAEEFAQRINDLYTQNQGGQGEFPLTVTHDPITNSLVVRGPAKTISEVRNLVAQIAEADSVNQTEVRIFALLQADAETASDLLQNVLEGRGGVVGGSGGGGGGSGGAQEEAARQVMLIYQQQDPRGMETYRAMRQDIVVTADVRTNSLFITAPPQSMPLMQSLVRAIDVPPRSDKIDVFALRNSDAEQMVETLDEIFATAGAGGNQNRGGNTSGNQDDQERQLSFGGASGAGREQITFTADVRTNSVIVAGTPGYLKLAEELVYQLDTQPIEDRKTLVYAPRNIVAAELATSIRDYSDAEQQRLDALGDEISVQRRQEREIVAIDNEDANRVILSYSPRFESQVLDIVRELDQAPPQVSIEVLIVEVTLENSLELGIEYAFQDLQFTKAGPTDTTTFDFVGGTDVGAAGSGLGGFTFTITGADFNFLFRTLASESRLKVLSRPHIVAMNNQEAEIEVVDDVPYISGTGTSIAGQVSTQVARESIGILLNVTPQINPDGFVRMEIRQEVSDISDSTVQVGPGVTAPIFFRRIADTTVTVRDGETVILGGLITSRNQESEAKVPVAGDIPIFGTLFRSTDNRDRQTELLVILTPRVIRSVEDFREQSIALRDKSSTLPGDILTHPLMNRLRVDPEDLHPQDQDGVFGSFDRPTSAPAPYNSIDYPARVAPPVSTTPAPTPQPYDVPIPRREQAAYDLPIPSGYQRR